MKNTVATMLLTAVIAAACNSSLKNIFSKQTPHEQYAEVLDDNDLDKTPEGRQWLAVSKTALADAQPIALPYRQHGYFAPGKARALGLKFTAKRGEKLTFTLDKKLPFVLFADLFRQEGSESSILLSADTASSQFSFDIEEAGSYVLRLQPELFRSGEYDLSVSVGPSLGFPVSGTKAKPGSFWGASRDGGKRRHEGVDIFAPKRTPAIAGIDGIITGVKNEGIGGKTVWLKTDRNITLYYAHLDKQLVHVGQLVKKGEIVGLVGNTGNAKHTPSHLHFGIYTSAGPINPFPFIDKKVKTAPPVKDKNLTGYLRMIKTQKLGSEKIAVSANTLMVPLAVTSKGYISELPDGNVIEVPFAAVKSVEKPVKSEGVAASAGGREGKDVM
jgi:murein DD-endopeptidase MepM/ murein hydrolase activator NlpD